MSTILVVEDNDKNMKLVRDVLRFKGYDTLEAVDGGTGVRLALQHGPALVLMDLQLPDIDGIEALRRIRAGGATMPVVVVTASVMLGDQQRIAGSGFDAFISKPIQIKSFLQTVARFAPPPERNP